MDLNDPYMKMNVEDMDKNDYLGMLSPPSFDVLSTPAPRYVNANVIIPLLDEIAQGYTSMGSSEVFSPRSQDDDVFTFRSEREKEPNMGKPKLNR